MPNLIGQSIGRYHILEQLGEGGMATVYKARDLNLERDVAVKVIRTDIFGSSILERMLKRFQREGRTLGKLTHPNIVPILDFGDYNGAPYLVMPYLPGGTLKQKMKGQIPYHQAVQMLMPVAQALVHAHQQGIIHRDVKPANILITRTGELMLSDFGIARIIDSEETRDLTSTGVGIGTPEYMAPEQGMGQADERSDIYALGIVLYEMVTGRIPFRANTPMAILLKKNQESLTRPTQFAPDLPQAMENVLIKALARKPDDRYESVGEMLSAMEMILGGVVTNGKQHTSPTKTQSVQSSKKTRDTLATMEQIDTNATIEQGKEPTADDAPMARLQNPVTITLKQQPQSNILRYWPLALGGLLLVCVFLVGLVILSQQGLVSRKPSEVTETPTIASVHTPPTPTTIFRSPTETQVIPSPSPALGIGSVWTSSVDGMMMLYIPAGEFTMGSNDGQQDEKPAHNVYLDAYWMDKTEVTNSMYAKCVQAGRCVLPRSSSSNTRNNYYGNVEYENFPVVYVTRDNAQTYCEWANRRLATEAEWEKAARGTDSRRYPWGNEEPTDLLLNIKIQDTTQVGSYQRGASFYGLLDMGGNVWEWASDWYSSSYYSNSPQANPLGPDSGIKFVARGGGWLDMLGGLFVHAKTTYRGGFYTTYSDVHLGFRCARSVP